MVAEQARAEVGLVAGILAPPHSPPATLLPALEPTSPLAAHWLAPPLPGLSWMPRRFHSTASLVVQSWALVLTCTPRKAYGLVKVLR